ncbi:MAG: DUF4130 domain-containing protein [Candidatus Hodarchaeota archaeon]
MFRKIERNKVIDSLSRHKYVTSEFLNKVKSIPKEILENLGTEDAKKAVSMSSEVDRDLHEHKAFLRFKISPYGVLYAKLEKMQHYNEDKLLKFFKTRFPMFILLFESNRGVFLSDHNSSILFSKRSLETVLSELEKKLPLNSFLLDLKEGNYEEIWESFAKSQLIQTKEASRPVINLSKKWKNTVPVNESVVKTLDQFIK